MARGHRTLTLCWLSAETTGSQSCARQRPPEQTTGWQPREEVMGLAPTRGHSTWEPGLPSASCSPVPPLPGWPKACSSLSLTLRLPGD